MMNFLFHVLVFPGFLASFFIGILYYGIVRKVSAHMQNRIGPPIWQPFYDFVKLMSKENITTKESVGFLMTLCPIISISAFLTTLMFIPVGGKALLSFPGDMIMVIYMLVIASAFTAISGFATGNPFAKIGSIREITQMIAYEFPFIVSLITIGLITGFKIQPFLAVQFPFTFLAFLSGVLGKLSLPPFHIPDAEQEIVAGPFTEYSGPRLAMFELDKFIGFWVLVSMSSVMLMGATNIISFFINSFVVLFILIVLRTIFGRLRITQAFKLYWLVIAPLAIIDLLRVMFGLYW